MPVLEYPVVNDLTFQAWDSATGSWRNLAAQATRVKFRRGGQQNGASRAMQVGTLDATLYGANNLAAETAVKPNSPIRVVRNTIPTVTTLWNLHGTVAGLPASAVAPVPPATPANVSIGANTVAGSISVGWTPAAGAVAFAPAGSLVIGTNSITGRTSDATNVKPTGVFEPRRKYVVRANGTDTGDGFIAARMALVVYTGSATNPTIVAQGATRAAGGSQTPFPPLRFSAPEADWQIGVALIDGVAVDNSAGTSSVRAMSVNVDSLRVESDDQQRAEFTGVILDLQQTVDYDKQANQKQVFTTVTAVDSVSSLAQTDRYGAISTSGTGYQSWANRIAQLSTSALVPVNLPGTFDTTKYLGPDSLWGGSALTLPGGTISNTRSPGVSSATLTRGSATSSTPAQNVTPTFTREFINTFVKGTTYTLSVDFRQGGTNPMTDAMVQYLVNGRVVAASDVATLNTDGTATTLGLTFTATSTRGTLRVIAATPVVWASGTGTRTTASTVTNAVIVQNGDLGGYLLQDTALQSNLATHYDMACASVGAYWWVDRDNVVVFARALPTVPQLTIGDTDDATVSYTDVSLAFDTRNTVNALKMQQHGRDLTTGNALDYNLTANADASVRRWGIRADAVDVSIYTGPGHEGDLVRRGQEMMTDLQTPRYQVSTLTFNVRSSPAVMDVLDLYQMISVRYENVRQTCRVLSITEEITPTRWTCSLEFTDVRAGATFADVDAANPGTFADFTAKWSGKTFNDLTANPTA